jgi:hypothetical protein
MDHANAVEETAGNVSIARCRELLGEDAEGISDQDIELVRQHAETMAHVLVEVFLQRGITE